MSKPGRHPRKEAVDKTTVYFLESDLLILHPKNRAKALAWAREIAKEAVSKQAKYLVICRFLKNNS